MPEILTGYEERIFRVGETWPPKEVAERNARYHRAACLYEGKHEDVFRKEIGIPDSWRFVPVPFPQLISHVQRDMLFRKNPKYVRTDEEGATADEIDRIIRESQIWQTARQAGLSGSYLGDVYLRVGVNFYGKPQTQYGISVDTVDPRMVVPIADDADGSVMRALYQTWTIKQGDGANAPSILYAERHRAGEVWLRKFLVDSSKRITGSLAVDPATDGDEVQEFDPSIRLLVHIPNRRSAFGLYGRSDYAGIEPIFRELDNRETRRTRILDEFSSPKLKVPIEACQRDDASGYYTFKADEVIPVTQDTRGEEIGYLTWDARLDAAEKQVEFLKEWAFLGSDTSEAAFGTGVDKSLSGVALYLKMSRSILTVENKIDDWEQALSSVLLSVQLLENQNGAQYQPSRPSIQMEAGAPEDWTAIIDDVIKLKSASLIDEETALRRIFPNMEQREFESLLGRIQSASSVTRNPFRDRLQSRADNGQQPGQPPQQPAQAGSGNR